jgi:GAF domain-containing protein/lipopolysaccharide biosynthesis regulator YciM
MPDIEKLFEKAGKYVQKQKFEAALEAFQEIYRYEPSDEEVLLNLGDLSLKLNRTAEGLRYQAQLADLYIKRNDTAKAAATCRKILKLSPQDVVTLRKLASVLERAGKTSETLEAYREALDLYRQAGTTAQVIECLQHIVKLDPDHLEEHVELAELASRAQQPKVATPVFLRAAELARAAGQEDRCAELVERAHLLDPSDEPACLAAAEVFLRKGRHTEVVGLLEPIVQAQPDHLAALELLSRGYLALADYAHAQPLCWKLYQAKPETVVLLLELVEGLVRGGSTEKALELVTKLKEHFFQRGKRNELLRIVEKIYAADESNLQILEALSALYNELNKEDGLHRSLTRLFNLYLASEQYEKAADTLERILDVDPYGEGHPDRLLNLEGHIDSIWYKDIQTRALPPSMGRVAAAPGAPGGAAAQAKTEALEDLVVEGEIFLHYQLSSKLTETLEKLNRLYSGAEERNPRLRELYDLAGFIPKPAPGAAPAPPPAAAEPEPARAPAGPPAQPMDDLRKISEITANICREGTPQGVMQVAANQLGRALNASRCWGALGAPDRPPALTVEYCSPAASPSNMAAALELYAALMRQAVTNPDGWSVEEVTQAQVLAPVRAEIQDLRIKSFLALPLLDRDEPAGLLLLEECEAPRAWSPSEVLLLKAIATQVVTAVNNTKLRRLVRSLAGTDPETGLLPRSSYLDCLLSEAQRAKDLAQPLTVCLLEPENPTTLMKTLGEAGVQRYSQQVSKSMISALRQNDIAIRYSPLAMAVVFPGTALPQGGLAVEKVRRVISQVKVDGTTAPNYCAAVCDVPLGPDFDPVDGVTEVINRLAASLEQARSEGGKRVLLSKFGG